MLEISLKPGEQQPYPPSDEVIRHILLYCDGYTSFPPHLIEGLFDGIDYSKRSETLIACYISCEYITLVKRHISKHQVNEACHNDVRDFARKINRQMCSRLHKAILRFLVTHDYNIPVPAIIHGNPDIVLFMYDNIKRGRDRIYMTPFINADREINPFEKRQQLSEATLLSMLDRYKHSTSNVDAVSNLLYKKRRLILRTTSSIVEDNITAFYMERIIVYTYKYTGEVNARRNDKAFLDSIDASAKRAILGQINAYLSRNDVCTHLPFDKFKSWAAVDSTTGGSREQSPRWTTAYAKGHTQVLLQLVDLLMHEKGHSSNSEIAAALEKLAIDCTGIEIKLLVI